MKGCESDATVDDGIALLQQTANGWSRLQYQKGLGFSECLKFRALDIGSNLLCNHSSSVDEIQARKIFWINITENTFSRIPFLRWYDNTGSNPCELVSVFPHRFICSDFNQDGRSDVRISFRIREHLMREKYSGALHAINSGYPVNPAQSLSLTHLFSGETLKLHEDSQEKFPRINQIVKSICQQLIGDKRRHRCYRLIMAEH